MPEGGRLAISAVADTGQVRLIVADTGPGISAEEIHRIFEPFYSTKVRGIGLGLAICRAIVENHQGEIRVTSQPGQGSHFTVFLPVGGLLEAQTPGVSDMPRSEPHILVVDDEQDICANLRDILVDFGYQVDTAADGDAALKLLESRAYDVALLDLKMPGISGVELCRQIRERQSSTVGMILTAYASPQAAHDAIQAGAWRVLSKPIDTPQLMQLIESALNTPLVLVVDDDRDLCDALRDMFHDQGFRVSMAHTPGEVERQLADSAPHVVLIDLKLAEWDGLQVFEQVRRPDARGADDPHHRVPRRDVAPHQRGAGTGSGFGVLQAVRAAPAAGTNSQFAPRLCGALMS